MGAVTEVIRSEGLTPSERYLKRLCDRSFLTLWSYPNLYLNKGKGQELCDLLVVFGRHVIIFSDKSCKYPNTGKPELDWSRWFRRSVSASADQVFGAERWIRLHPDRIFLDPKCTQRFPLALPSDENLIVHRVVVALGAAERCRQFFGGSGSLMISPLCHLGERRDAFLFTVGDLSPDRGYVHVLDDVTLDIVLGELDTIADFVSYLTAKERLVRSGKLVGAAGEEELLAYYLRNLDPNNEHEFNVPEGATAISIDEGFWTDLETNPQYLAKKRVNEVSYVWDNLIEAFNKNIAAGTLVRGAELGLQAHEEAVRLMAGEPRTARRLFGQSIMEKMRTTRPDGESTRLMGTRQRPTVGYVFMLVPRETGEDYNSYRDKRVMKLEAYCRVAKVKLPQVLDIVGVATEPGGSHGSSEDMIYMDTRTWTAEDEDLAKELHESGLLKTTRDIEVKTYEFPRLSASADPDAARRERNRRKKARQNAKR